MILNTMTKTCHCELCNLKRGNLTPKNLIFREIRHLSKTFDKFTFFLQNEPNLNIWFFGLSSLLTDSYANFAAPNVKKNKPKQTQNKPISNPFKSRIQQIQDRYLSLHTERFFLEVEVASFNRVMISAKVIILIHKLISLSGLVGYFSGLGGIFCNSFEVPLLNQLSFGNPGAAQSQNRRFL